MLLRIGETIDRYKIEALIGQGGMAAVYRVRHVQLDSEHALKVLFITAPQIYQRLIREGRVQANLRHPNIVSVTDVLNIHGSPALVMEHVEGPALDTWLLENRPTLEEGLWLFRGILRGMTTAHDRGVVHRDLKPANVLLAPGDEGFVPKVTDFGLVKSVVDQRGDTQTGMSLGTPEYMSPEQIRDASDIDTRADMWALGCILYELVCHKRAFQGQDKLATFQLICSGQYDAPRLAVPNLPRSVAEAIKSLLEIDRNQRLSSCDALYDLLYQDNEPKIGRIAAPARPIVPLKVDPPSVDPAPLLLANQLNVPTGAPANQRVSRPPPQFTVEVPPPSRPAGESRSRPWVGLAIAVAAGFGGASVATFSQTPSVVAAQAPATPQLGEAMKEPPAIERPVVVAPPPPEELSREPSLVRVIGDVREVWLVSEDRSLTVREPVAPGQYEILADFGGAVPVGAGALDVPPGQSITLTCSRSLQLCRPLPRGEAPSELQR